MPSKKKSASYSSNEILKAQREYANAVHKGFKNSTPRTIQNLINANPPEVASEWIAHSLIINLCKLHYLFLFSINSDDDSSVFSMYSSAYSTLSVGFSNVEDCCKKTKVSFKDICSLVMQRTPPFVFQGRGIEGHYPWEDGLSELAVILRSKYAEEMTDKNHINVMKELFSQYGIKY